MCGFCGVINPSSPDIAQQMLESIKHRGPDSFDTKIYGPWALGGCRLSILQNIISSLIFHDNEGRCVLLNGEIYNYREVAGTLGLPIHMHGNDLEAEIILELYKQNGVDAIRHLEGMFSFVILDGNKIIMARDRFGIKPLFFSKLGKEIIFASEIKAILKHPRVSVTLDFQALDETSVFGYITSPKRTAFAEIRQVPPASVTVFEDGKESTFRYWKPPVSYYAEDQSLSLDEMAVTVKHAVASSLESQMQHDTNDKGFYLSGGIDSSFIAVLASQLQSKPIKTFTLADSSNSADLLMARHVAAAIGSDHHEYEVSFSDYIEELPFFTRHFENVIAGGVFNVHGGMAFQILTRRISDHVRVAFSGEGADELFGGYYWAYTHPLGFSDRIRERANQLFDNQELIKQVNELFPQPENEKVYCKNLYDFLLKGGLTNYHLWSVDRSSSAFGSEVRPVYLDAGIAETALALPIEAKIYQGETKRVLRAAARPLMKELGIEKCVTRKKDGMPAAVQNIAPSLEKFANNLIPTNHVINHPFSRYVHKPMDALMFDLFTYIFIENRGDLPTDFKLDDLYKSREYAHMYC